MATLTRTSITQRFSLQQRKSVSSIAPFSGTIAPSQLLFIVGSIAVHAGLLTFVSSAPTPAHAAVNRSEFSVDLVELSSPVEEVIPEPAPLGKLDAPLHPSSSSKLQTQAVEPIPALDPGGSREDSNAPRALTALNPYASADASSFTSGSSSARVTRRVVATPAAGPTFGVESGSAEASEETKNLLNNWYRQVRSQLATVGSRSYPRRAQKLGLQGTTKVTVNISASGTITGVSVSTSSGHATLDRSALGNLRSIGSVAAPPQGTGATRVTFPVTFLLR